MLSNGKSATACRQTYLGEQFPIGIPVFGSRVFFAVGKSRLQTVMVLGGEATSRTSDETLTARLSLANIFMQSDQFDQAEGIYMQLARTMFFLVEGCF